MITVKKLTILFICMFFLSCGAESISVDEDKIIEVPNNVQSSLDGTPKSSHVESTNVEVGEDEEENESQENTIVEPRQDLDSDIEAANLKAEAAKLKADAAKAEADAAKAEAAMANAEAQAAIAESEALIAEAEASIADIELPENTYLYNGLLYDTRSSKDRNDCDSSIECSGNELCLNDLGEEENFASDDDLYPHAGDPLKTIIEVPGPESCRKP